MGMYVHMDCLCIYVFVCVCMYVYVHTWNDGFERWIVAVKLRNSIWYMCVCACVRWYVCVCSCAWVYGFIYKWCNMLCTLLCHIYIYRR